MAMIVVMSAPLDDIDRKILRVLQAEGRASNVELAAQVHLSAPQCYRRVRALEEGGVIRGYSARVEAEALGLAVTAYVSVSIAGDQFGRVREIEAQIRDYPQILECQSVSGDYDYLLKVVAKRPEEPQHLPHRPADAGRRHRRRALDDLPGGDQAAVAAAGGLSLSRGRR